MAKVLVIGGAGFIASHLVDALVDRNLRVCVLDNLDPQVHGADREPPPYMNSRAQLIVGDIRDRELLRGAMSEAEVVFHLASAVGVGQSMYEIEKYASINTQGTAVLLDLLANQHHTVRKLIVASSMSIYGEGSYRCERCGLVEPSIRSDAQLQASIWEPSCPHCNGLLESIPTPESKSLHPTSIYAITKKSQEEMSLCIGKAYGIPTVALRFFNVYGPRQALSNPYTGAAAIFSSRAMNGRPPLIFEDGLQTRDFVHVSDVVQANLIAMDSESANYQVFNVGTGKAHSILEMAGIICERVGPPGLKPEVTYKYRKGDIRHCSADISKISALGYKPKVKFEDGIRELAEWVRSQTAVDRVDQAAKELIERRLIT